MSEMGDIWRQLLGIALGSACAFSTSCADAQIIPDRTLPNNSNVTINGRVFNITGGTQAGRNLFHSFQQFSVPTGGTASFNNELDIQNIITRVTGGEVSNIDGLIKASGTANLFFLNPNGIVFGQNASLNIGGSFVATTANAIQFGNIGTFSATTPEAPSPLLTVNPTALFYNQIVRNASIQNSSIASAGVAPTGVNSSGLRVSDGQSLLLVGGDIQMDGGRLRAYGGRVELGGLATPGTVELGVDGNNLSLSFPTQSTRASVSLINGASVNVSAANGGSITVNASNINISGGGLSAGIGQNLGSVGVKAGDITLNGTGDVKLDGSFILNIVEPQATGNGGNINITTGTLSLTNGAELLASTFGHGNAGSININARGTVSFDGEAIAFSNVESGGVGNGGNINITTGTLSLTNGAVLAASTFGHGNAGSVNINARDTVSFDGAASAFSDVESGGVGNGGNINITTGTLSLTNGVELVASTYGYGNAGSVNINARDTVSFDGRASAFSNVESGGVGNGGNINITTGTLSLTNAQLAASTFGHGNAGSVNINARDTVSFDGGASAFSDVESGGVGNGGNINITAGTLSLSNGAGLIARIQGQGNGGNINIKANQLTLSSDAVIEGDLDLTGKGRGADINLNVTGQILLTGSETQQAESTRITLGSLPGAVGSAGNLTIHAGSLVLKDGGFVKDSSQAQNGSAGNIDVYADQVNISGTGASSGLSSGLFTSTISGNNAGNITVNTSTFYIADGAALSARTTGNGQGGDITVNASRSLEAVNGGQLVTTTSGNGNAGSILVNAKERVTISGTDSNYSKRSDLQDQTQKYIPPSSFALIANNIKEGSASALFANADTNSAGTAGNLTINTGKLQVYNQAEVFVQSLGTGTAGNLTVNARSIRLDNGTLSANTRSNSTNPNLEQATIALHSGDLILSRGSKITTNATGSNVIGGNINIDTDVLAAVENSFISANSTDFRGGRVIINASGIFLSPNSTITATGANSQLNGTVQTNTPEVDPSLNLVTLPTITERSLKPISPNCAAFDEKSGGSNFTVTGHSGLPPSPDEPFTSDVVWTDTRLPATTLQHQHKTHATKPKPQPIAIIPATGWVFNNKGEVTLISSVSNPTSIITPTSCPAL